MEIHPLDIVIHLINILVLYALLRLLLYNPVRKFLQKRSNEVQQKLNEAEASSNEALSLKASCEEQLEVAKQQMHKLRLDSTLEANKSAAAIIEAAQRQSEELLEAAREKTRQERAKSIADAQHDVESMAVSLAEQILRREIIKEDNQKVIDAFFEKR